MSLQEVAPRKQFKDGRGNRHGTRWRGNLKVPAHAHPLVRQFIEILNDEQTSIKEVAERAGHNRHTMGNWRSRLHPRVDQLEAALNVVDYELVIRKRKMPK